MLRRLCAPVVMLALLFTLVGLGWTPAPGTVPAPAASADVAPAPANTPAPTFLPDGAHLAPGVTLRLAALGRGESLAPVDAVNPTDDGTRVQYAHGDVREWYVRQGGQGAGVEQGITLAASPAGDGPLVLTIATPGAAALVNETGDAATLLLPNKTRWQYDGLHVTDAAGRVLPSHLVQAADGGIGITADDAGAIYPITIDPFVQQEVIGDPDGMANDRFGAVAVSGDGTTLAVGAYGASSSQGKVYVYTRSGSFYTLTVTLNDPAATDFGGAVALSANGNTLAVGAGGTNSLRGRAYLYNRNGGSYGTPQIIDDPLNTPNDSFGTVALSADASTLAVGAYPSINYHGRMYVYTRNMNLYTLTATLNDPAPMPMSHDDFGIAVSLNMDGATLVVGADGTNGGQFRGNAYVYTRSNNAYTLAVTLSAPMPVDNDQFGLVVALSADGSTIAVGAPSASSFLGNTFLFTRNGNTYILAATLNDPGATTNDAFGVAVSLSANGNTLAVGARDALGQQGIAYVYTRSNNAYTLATTLGDPAATNQDIFGNYVSLSADGSTLAVGANGTSSNQGRAYVYTDAPVLAADATTTNQSATVGAAFATQLVAHVTDGDGVPLAGVPVQFSAPGAGAGGTFLGARTALVTSNVNGVAIAPVFTANNTAGSYTVTATATTTGGTVAAAFALTNTADLPASITAGNGNGQSAPIGFAFSDFLQAVVRDSHGNPVSGATVTFSAPAGNVPSVTFPGGNTALTDSNGVAGVSAIAAGRPGLATITASVSNDRGTVSTSIGVTDTAAPGTVTLTGFSPPTGPTAGGTSVTITGTNLAGVTLVYFGRVAATITGNTATSITVTAPAHAAGTVDIGVTASGQTATIHGYTYLDTGNIAPQPPMHPLPGSGAPGPMVQPGRHDDAGGSGGGGPGPNAVMPTPQAQPGRH